MSARADDPVFTTEGEAGVVISAGNSNAQSYNFKDLTSYAFSGNTFKLGGHYLGASANGADTAKNWDLGLRYERVLYKALSAYLGQEHPGQHFADTLACLNTNVGAKYDIIIGGRSRLGARRIPSPNPRHGCRAPTRQHFVRFFGSF